MPREYHRPIQQTKVQKRCVFCIGYDNYYNDIVREWYDVSNDTKFPRGLKPDTCLHDEWLTEYSVDLAFLVLNCVKKNDYNLHDRGVSFADVDPQSPKDVLNLLSDPGTMEFILLRNLEYQRPSLSEEVTQSARRADISISYEQFEEIEEMGRRKVKQLSAEKLTSKEFFEQLHEYVKVFDPRVDDKKINDVMDILNIFNKREKEDNLCKEAIEMLKRLQNFVASHDWNKRDLRTEEQKKYRMKDQWQHNLHHVKQDRKEFYAWLEKTEAKLGRKANVIDRIAEHLD